MFDELQEILPEDDLHMLYILINDVNLKVRYRLTYFWLLLVVQRHLVGSQVITKCPPFDTVSTVQAVVETWHTWMIDNVHQIRIKCMLETIDRTRSGTSNKFWQGIKQSNGTPPETIIGKCARSTNVYMRDNTISSSTLRMGAYYGF